MDKDTAISFEHVTKIFKLYKNDRQRFKGIFSSRVEYKEKVAIDDLTLTVKRGEAVALFGKNGAGKSTALKMITGVIFPTEGKIDVNGRVSALLELTAGFDPEFTGRENIYLRGQLMGLPEDEIKRLEPDIVEFADIGEYMDQPVRTYSSGMKARLGFGINVSIDPEILIVDEALSVGDKEFRAKCTDKIQQLLNDKGITFLFVTHSVSVAKEFCSRGIVLRKGKLVFDGDIDEAIKKYDAMVKKDIERRKAKMLFNGGEK